jgi:hypothetical protein
MSATITCRAMTGSGAGTQSGAQTAISLLSIDAASGDPDDEPIAPGSNSFERWLRFRVDAAPEVGVADFWVESAGELPDGVTIRFGVTDTGVTPKATTSTIATTELVAGRRYVWDTNIYSDIGDTTRYLVLQGQVAADAADGPIDTQGITIGWRER